MLFVIFVTVHLLNCILYKIEVFVISLDFYIFVFVFFVCFFVFVFCICFLKRLDLLKYHFKIGS